MPISSSGPQPASILVVGEAPGKSEERLGIPFVGEAGVELKRMLAQAGINPLQCRFTNVFMTQPRNGDIASFCGKRAEVGKDYTLPPISLGKYVLPSHLHELERLKDEILTTRPKLILALGNTAAWALLHRTGISKLRGSIFPNSLLNGGPAVFPTYHPAAILRDWSIRVIGVADLLKAGRHLTEGFAPPRRELWLEPTIEEVEEFCARLLESPPPLLSVDVETLSGTVTCVGFAPTESLAITIPFFDPTAEGKNYWPTATLERRAYLAVKRVMQSPIPKLGQNFLYDIQYFLPWGIQPQRVTHDTMIRHHALYPEMEKSLGFMGSIYTDEAPWKLLRDRNKDNFKADDE